MPATFRRNSFEILLVEDNPGDAHLTRSTLQERRAGNRVNVAEDGEQALAFLRRQGEYAGAPQPHLILLDLNLPRLDGREVLAEIKADPRLKHIPVVVLSSSEADRDICGAYDLHANCYVTKPLDLDQYIHVMHTVHDFWFATAKLPARE